MDEQHKPLTTAVDLSTAVSSIHLVQCSNTLDTDDPALINFNAQCADNLIIAQKAGQLLAKDVTKMTGLTVHDMAANEQLEIITDNFVVASYLMSNCIIADWRPRLAAMFEGDRAIEAMLRSNCKHAIVCWQYTSSKRTCSGSYAITI